MKLCRPAVYIHNCRLPKSKVAPIWPWAENLTWARTGRMSGNVHSWLQVPLRLDAVCYQLSLDLWCASSRLWRTSCSWWLASCKLQQFSNKKGIKVQLPGLILNFKLKLEPAQLILSSNGRLSQRLIVITHKGWDASKVSYWIYPSKIFMVVIDYVWGRALAPLYKMVVLFGT